MRPSVKLGVALALAAGLATPAAAVSAAPLFLSHRPVPHMLLGRGMRFAINGLQPKKNPDPYDFVMANDGVYGNVDLYQYDSYYGVAIYLQTFSGLGAAGGMASYGPNSFAFASNTYGVLYGNIQAGSIYSLNLTAQLTPTHADYGVNGLAFDRAGDLYVATKFGGCIDEWRASTIAHYNGTPLPPDVTACTSGFFDVNSLATDGKTVYAFGDDEYTNLMLATVAFPSGKTKITETGLGNSNDGTGIAYGVSVTSSHEVYVNNGLEIFGFLKGRGTANQTETVVQGQTQISSINLSYGDQTLFGAEFTAGGGRAGLLCMSVPLNTAYPCGTSGFNGSEVYYGIAAVSAPKN